MDPSESPDQNESTIQNESFDRNETSLLIEQDLKNIFQEEILKPAADVHPKLRNTSYLLDKLIQKEKPNMAILSLYNFSKGYALSLCRSDGQKCQETYYSYDNEMLLDYIDREELPPPLLHLWEHNFPEIFYTGCVIMRVKDFRYSQEPQVHHVLLKPHTQSFVNDVNLIIREERKKYSMEDRISIESAIINSVCTPLCLDPSLDAGLKRFHNYSSRMALNTSAMRKSVLKNSQLHHFKKKRSDELFFKPNRNLINFINKKKQEKALICETMCSPIIKGIDEFISFKDLKCEFKNVNQLAKPINKRSKGPRTDSDTKKLVEEYVLEPEHQPCEDDEPDSSYHISFTLGSKSNASRYIKHFTDIFTTEGGKSVRLTHIIPGQPTREACTNSMLERDLKNQTSIRIQSNGKKFMQIGPNTIGNLQHSSFKGNQKITVQQFHCAGKALGAGSSVNCSSEGTPFNFHANNSILSRFAIPTAAPNNQQLNRNGNQKQKIVSRKMNFNTSKVRPNLGGSTSTSLKIPLSKTATNQRAQEQVLSLSDVNLHSTINVNTISQNISSVNCTNLKGFKSAMMRNVHSLTNNLDSSTSIQTALGVPTVHLISGIKETPLPPNGQSTTSSLSLSLPGLSALLADSSLKNSQILKKNGASHEPPQ